MKLADIPAEQLTLTQARRIADGHIPHARQHRDKPLDDCKHCQAIVRWFASLPLPLLSKVLEDRPTLKG